MIYTRVIRIDKYEIIQLAANNRQTEKIIETVSNNY